MPVWLAPGGFVRLTGRPDWGVGQIQSVIGDRVTVNFQHGGKQLIRRDLADLIRVEEDAMPGRRHGPA